MNMPNCNAHKPMVSSQAGLAQNCNEEEVVVLKFNSPSEAHSIYNENEDSVFYL